jgi:hypothetical protein
MSVPQRINDYITAMRPAAICNRCLAGGVGLSNDAAHPAQVTGALATTSDFTQKVAACSRCKQVKKVIRAIRS